MGSSRREFRSNPDGRLSLTPAIGATRNSMFVVLFLAGHAIYQIDHALVDIRGLLGVGPSNLARILEGYHRLQHQAAQCCQILSGHIYIGARSTLVSVIIVWRRVGQAEQRTSWPHEYTKSHQIRVFLPPRKTSQKSPLSDRGCSRSQRKKTRLCYHLEYSTPATGQR